VLSYSGAEQEHKREQGARAEITTVGLLWLSSHPISHLETEVKDSVRVSGILLVNSFFSPPLFIHRFTHSYPGYCIAAADTAVVGQVWEFIEPAITNASVIPLPSRESGKQSFQDPRRVSIHA
jgi:hypothetical protein